MILGGCRGPAIFKYHLSIARCCAAAMLAVHGRHAQVTAATLAMEVVADRGALASQKTRVLYLASARR